MTFMFNFIDTKIQAHYFVYLYNIILSLNIVIDISLVATTYIFDNCNILLITSQ